jgi:hypothetical protein
MRFAALFLALVLLWGCAAGARSVAVIGRGPVEWPGFSKSVHWDEQELATTIGGDVRVLMNAPAAASVDASLPARLIVYALPNGNTIEQTAGRQLREGDHWRFDIQHIAAQTRMLRETVKDETIVVVYLEAAGLSWPTWRREREDSGGRLVALMNELRTLANPRGGELRIFLTGHSGGGSLTFGYLNALEAVPEDVDRIAFLDSNYGYAAEDGHGTKLLAWLTADRQRTLIVMAYDDREIELDGKKVVGPSGGTWRASQRMIDDFAARGVTFQTEMEGPFIVERAMGRQVIVMRHPNPQNKILHTVMVGEMNGLLHTATLRTKWEEACGSFGEPRVYGRWVETGE